VGHYGPTENAWRNSSDYAYAVQIAAALMKPAVYFSQFIDTYSVYYNTDLNQYLTLTNHHIRQTDVGFNGDTSSGTITRSAGYLNWVADYLRNIGADLKYYVDIDEIAEDIADSDGIGIISSYDGEYDEQMVTTSDGQRHRFVVMRIN
jgi:hypothetical protein